MAGKALREKLAALPLSPGVYLMRDAAGEVIYVGKALRLRERVRSYFQKYHQENDHKVFMLSQLIDDLEVIVTRSEVEALVLEDQLIKSHRPRFNVRLKDDKRFPFIKLTDETYPRLLVTRRVERDGARYFGPYTNAQLMRETLNALRRLYPVRTCADRIEGHPTRRRPCLDYFIKECTAPCVQRVSPEGYAGTVDGLARFLSGRHREALKPLEAEMNEAAEALAFERAAQLRDTLASLQTLVGPHKAVGADSLAARDVLGLAAAGGGCAIPVFFVRDGAIKGREHALLEVPEGSTPGEALQAFVTQFYIEAAVIPREVLLSEPLAEADWIARWLSQRAGQTVRLSAPRRGPKRRLVQLAVRNAELALFEAQHRDRQEARRRDALTELQRALELPRAPERIECYDVSNFQGGDAVGAMTVFEGGQPSKRDYRRFKIKTVRGADDFAMMAEMLGRRLRRGLQEQDALAHRPAAPAAVKFAKLPDLIVVDGGKGQLSAAQRVLAELGLADLPLAALAKRREEVYLPGRRQPVLLPRDSQALFLLQHVRDEAHRFGVRFHRALRQRRTVHSALDDIPGVGPKRRAKLIGHFGSVARIKAASVEEIEAAGVSSAVARAVYAALGDGGEEGEKGKRVEG